MLLVRRIRLSSARAGIPFSDDSAETDHDPISASGGTCARRASPISASGSVPDLLFFTFLFSETAAFPQHVSSIIRSLPASIQRHFARLPNRRSIRRVNRRSSPSSPSAVCPNRPWIGAYLRKGMPQSYGKRKPCSLGVGSAERDLLRPGRPVGLAVQLSL